MEEKAKGERKTNLLLFSVCALPSNDPKKGLHFFPPARAATTLPTCLAMAACAFLKASRTWAFCASEDRKKAAAPTATTATAAIASVLDPAVAGATALLLLLLPLPLPPLLVLLDALPLPPPLLLLAPPLLPLAPPLLSAPPSLFGNGRRVDCSVESEAVSGLEPWLSSAETGLASGSAGTEGSTLLSLVFCAVKYLAANSCASAGVLKRMANVRCPLAVQFGVG